MSQTGTPTEFLQLGITEPDDTLNVLVDLNGQWRKIDTGVKNVDTKANTNASGISALNTAVQDNTENITNILETNVNQQTSIDTLQAKVATLEEDDTSYGTRITAVEAGVQENSELINDLEVDLSGVKTSVGTVPSGSNLQGEVNGLDTRVTALENSGSVAAVEARVTTLETEVGTVPAGETVQGQITTLNGQVNSGNIPFRFSVDGGGNYGYLKADDSFVPFRSGDSHWHELDTTLYDYNSYSFITNYKNYSVEGSEHYGKIHNFINDVDYTLPFTGRYDKIIGCVIYRRESGASYLINGNNLTPINDSVVAVLYDKTSHRTYYLTRSNNNYHLSKVDADGNIEGHSIDFTLRGTSTSPVGFSGHELFYKYNNTSYKLTFDYVNGTCSESVYTDNTVLIYRNYFFNGSPSDTSYYNANTGSFSTSVPANGVIFNCLLSGNFFVYAGSSKYYYYL